uniref:Uncharacterized protein n=1 Tax=Knipowitschia caucasica TaxID=637954 RepID=A0AAV2M2Z7_KNICA
MKAANVDADVLQTLTREDLKDLFPGPEHFRRRKAIWDLAHPVEQATEESGTDCLQYPTKEGLQAMARRIMDYYPMVADWADTSCPWSNIFKKLNKRLQNIKSPQKWQGATPSRGNGKRRRLSFENTTGKELTDEGEEPVLDLSPCASKVSPSSTICTPERPQVQSPNTASENLVKSGPKLHDSRIAQARHYKTLQEMFRKPKQDKEAVAQLLDLEFEARRNFIDADLLKEPDKAAKIIDAYPCFKDIDNALDEVGRIIAKGQHNYVMELRERWEVFKQKLIFYAVYKKAMKSPMSLSKEEQAIELLKCLPVLFPSNAALPKKLSNASDALFHILLPLQEPGMFLQKRPLCTPVLLVDEDGCFISTTRWSGCDRLDAHSLSQSLDAHSLSQSLDAHSLSQSLDAHSLSQPLDAHSLSQPLDAHSLSQPLDAHSLSQPLDAHSLSQPLDAHSLSQPLDAHSLSEPLDAHSLSQPLDAHSLSQPLDAHSLSQPLDAHSLSEPLDAHSLSQPLDAHSLSQPLDAHSLSQPLDAHSLSQPLDAHSLSQPLDAHSLSQPLDTHSLSQPLDAHSLSQPLDAHSLSQPLDAHSLSQPLDTHSLSQPLDAHSLSQPLDAEAAHYKAAADAPEHCGR